MSLLSIVDQPRIGIDGFNLALPNGTGIATYGMTLANTLSCVGYPVEGVFGIDAGRDAGLKEILFFNNFKRSQSPSSPEERRSNARRRNRIALNPFLRARAVEVPMTSRVEKTALSEQLPQFNRLFTSPQLFAHAHQHFRYYGRFLPLQISNPPPIMHWTYPLPINLIGSRNIYTVHDLVPLKLPYTTLDRKREYHKLIAKCISHAARVCTVSESSRKDIQMEFGLDPSFIVNTYQACPPLGDCLLRDPAEDAAEIEGIFGLKSQGYFLFFGAVEPKKNLGRLLEAYLGLGIETPLVLAGGRSWQSEGELSLLPRGKELETERGRSIADRIIRLDHLSRKLLLKLIRGARAVLFPSLYEGFGLPILEAMQLGVPILTSDVSSMPEVAGDAAILVDPYNVAAIAQAIHRLESDQALRTYLSAAGHGQASKFSPERYSERLKALYDQVLA